MMKNDHVLHALVILCGYTTFLTRQLAGFDNCHKIAVHDHVRRPKFWCA